MSACYPSGLDPNRVVEAVRDYRDRVETFSKSSRLSSFPSHSLPSALGLKSIVAKDAKSPYVEGPTLTWHWQKVKNREYQRKEPVEFHPRRAAR